MWQGYGLNNALGLAGFPNAEAYRVGKTYPDVTSAARIFARPSVSVEER